MGRLTSDAAKRRISVERTANATRVGDDKTEARLRSACKLDSSSTTQIGNVIYDLTGFDHPGGEFMLQMARGRDATIMFESGHVRLEVARATLARLPVVIADVAAAGPLPEGFIEDDGPSQSSDLHGQCSPANSPLFMAVRRRVRKELLEPDGKCVGAVSARGVGFWNIAPILAYFFVSLFFYIRRPTVLTTIASAWGSLWVCMGIMHTACHGGLTRNVALGEVMGHSLDVLSGWSAMAWRFHHQVSHHSFANDADCDQDVYSSYPMLRFSANLKRKWYHRFQFLYTPFLFSLLWLSKYRVEILDLMAMRTFRVSFRGVSSEQVGRAWLLKFAHAGFLWILPTVLHGPCALAYAVLWWTFKSLMVATIFAVSHTLESAQPGLSNGVSRAAYADWGIWQVETAASWGGKIGSYLTGGLNLQIEHHLFPTLPHNYYPAIQRIVMEECAKRNVKYNRYGSLCTILVDMYRFLHFMGTPASDALVTKADQKQ